MKCICPCATSSRVAKSFESSSPFRSRSSLLHRDPNRLRCISEPPSLASGPLTAPSPYYSYWSVLHLISVTSTPPNSLSSPTLHITTPTHSTQSRGQHDKNGLWRPGDNSRKTSPLPPRLLQPIRGGHSRPSKPNPLPHARQGQRVRLHSRPEPRASQDHTTTTT